MENVRSSETSSKKQIRLLAGQIHMSSDASNLLEKIGGFAIESRGEVIIKVSFGGFFLNIYLQKPLKWKYESDDGDLCK